MTLEEAIAKIKPLDHNAMEIAQKRWDSIAKPLHSLGKMEKIVMQIAGITGSADVRLDKRALVAMCADNGVVEEGVTQTGGNSHCGRKLPERRHLCLCHVQTVRDRCISC